MSEDEAHYHKDSKLVRSLFSDYYSDLKRFVSSKFGSNDEADDIVQDAFKNILGKETLDDIQDPKAYLYRAANNLALNRLRQEKRHAAFQEKSYPLEQFPPPEQSVAAGIALEKIQSSIASLPEKPRRAFILSRVHNKTYTEISDELGVSVSAIEKYIIQTLRFLRNQVG